MPKYYKNILASEIHKNTHHCIYANFTCIFLHFRIIMGTFAHVEENRSGHYCPFAQYTSSGNKRRQAIHVVRLYTPSGYTRRQAIHAVRLYTLSGNTRRQSINAVRLYTPSGNTRRQAINAVRLCTPSGNKRAKRNKRRQAINARSAINAVRQ